MRMTEPLAKTVSQMNLSDGKRQQPLGKAICANAALILALPQAQLFWIGI